MLPIPWRGLSRTAFCWHSRKLKGKSHHVLSGILLPIPRGLGGALSADDCAVACFCMWQVWAREEQYKKHVHMLEQQVPSPSK